MDAFEGANARRYVRNTLVFTLIISIIANITETTLATSDISLWLRVPGAAVWPILAFRAIEILVRMLWERSFSHYLTRSLILIPGIPAIIVSYEHQRALLIAMGETGIVPFIGPIAIDGLMIGCTLALLVTRPSQDPEPAEPAEPEPAEFVTEGPTEIEVPGVIEEAEAIVRQAQRPRTPRSSTAPVVAVTALRDGLSVAEAAAAASMGVSTVRKYAAVLRILTENPNASIDAKAAGGIRQDMIDEMRSYARGLAGR